MIIVMGAVLAVANTNGIDGIALGERRQQQFHITNGPTPVGNEDLR